MEQVLIMYVISIDCNDIRTSLTHAAHAILNELCLFSAHFVPFLCVRILHLLHGRRIPLLHSLVHEAPEVLNYRIEIRRVGWNGHAIDSVIEQPCVKRLMHVVVVVYEVPLLRWIGREEQANRGHEMSAF